MTQFLFLQKFFPNEPNFVDANFGGSKGPRVLVDAKTGKHGQVFLSEVKLWVAHVDEGVKDEFLRHFYSMPSYAPSADSAYDRAGNLMPYTDNGYGGLKWMKLRGILDWCVKWFGRPFNIKPVTPPLKHSNLAMASERWMGKRTAGQVVMLAEVPDHKRQGSEDL